MAQSLQATPVRPVHPRVRLVAWTHDPYQIAVASARTCYASDFVFVGRLTGKGAKAQMSLEDAFPNHRDALDEIARADTPHERRLALVGRLAEGADPAAVEALDAFAEMARRKAEADDRIAASIYEAGHHTPFQHPTFVFALEDVSRHVVESFLHQHMFYNSEQQSQRYVAMAEAQVHVPASVAGDAEALAAYEAAVGRAWDAYHDLRGRLIEANLGTMAAIGRIKGQSEAQVRKEAEKKSQEMARYVLPIAAATRLYHTVSGIVLLRYARMCRGHDAPDEAQRVVEQMVEAVRAVDPAFVENVKAAALERHVEEDLLVDGPHRPAFDLGGHTSLLLRTTPDGVALVAQALRDVTGSDLPDGELLARVLDPARNPVWNDTLNTWDHSPALRALRHVHLTFHKRQSLTAYAQDQRHRMTPGTRPLLQRCLHGDAPDVHVPDVVGADAEALRVYEEAVRGLWETARRLRDEHGVPAADCTYLLPNATNIYYTQSGDLLSYIHKWRLRLCFNAQKEIFEAALDELRQAQDALPGLTRWLGPPCTFVAAAVPPELQDSVEACCPEGPRWCGVKVWRSFDAAKARPKRPY